MRTHALAPLLSVRRLLHRRRSALLPLLSFRFGFLRAGKRRISFIIGERRKGEEDRERGARDRRLRLWPWRSSWEAV
jgi:hypothetical protein